MVDQIFIMKQNNDMHRNDWVILVNLEAKRLNATRIDYVISLWFGVRAIIHYEVDK